MSKILRKKLKIYLWGDNSGVGWYRIHCPAKWIKKLDLAEVRTSDFRWTEEKDKIHFPSIEELNDVAHWADIIVFQRHDMLQHIATFCAIGEHFNMPVVLETDDNIDAVRPYNPGYRGYHPGSEALLWGNLVTKKVNAITVTTQNLHDVHQEDCPDNVYILPNSLDMPWREKTKKKVHDDGKIHMAWLGSAAHYENLKMIEEPVIEILKKHKNVVFHTMAMYGESVWADKKMKGIKSRIKRHKWTKLKEWPAFIASLGLDIGLAPARDNKFNRAKSNLRYLEYSVNKTATVASPTECYSCIKDGKTGLHASEPHEWFEAMDKLITDEKLRKTIGKNAYNDLKTNYNMEKNAKMWVNAYQKIVDKFKKEKGNKRFFYTK